MMRTLAFETDCEAGTENVNDEWYFGPYILVAPVLDSASSRSVFLPSGQWTDYADGKTVYEGGKTILYSAPLRKIPLFVKAGGIIPLGPAMQYSSEKPLNPLTLDVYPSTSPTSFALFEDDGEYGYEQGKYCTTKYDCVDKGGKVALIINARNASGGYSPGARSYNLRVHNRRAAKYNVKLNGTALVSDWSYDPAEQLIKLSIDDNGARLEVNIEPAAGGGEAPQAPR